MKHCTVPLHKNPGQRRSVLGGRLPESLSTPMACEGSVTHPVPWPLPQLFRGCLRLRPQETPSDRMCRSSRQPLSHPVALPEALLGSLYVSDSAWHACGLCSVPQLPHASLCACQAEHASSTLSAAHSREGCLCFHTRICTFPACTADVTRQEARDALDASARTRRRGPTVLLTADLPSVLSMVSGSMSQPCSKSSRSTRAQRLLVIIANHTLTFKLDENFHAGASLDLARRIVRNFCLLQRDRHSAASFEAATSTWATWSN